MLGERQTYRAIPTCRISERTKTKEAASLSPPSTSVVLSRTRRHLLKKMKRESPSPECHILFKPGQTRCPGKQEFRLRSSHWLTRSQQLFLQTALWFPSTLYRRGFSLREELDHLPEGGPAHRTPTYINLWLLGWFALSCCQLSYCKSCYQKSTHLLSTA